MTCLRTECTLVPCARSSCRIKFNPLFLQRVSPLHSGGNLGAEIACMATLNLLICTQTYRQRHLNLLQLVGVNKQVATVLGGNSWPIKTKSTCELNLIKPIFRLVFFHLWQVLDGGSGTTRRPLWLLNFVSLLFPSRCTSPRWTLLLVWACPQTPSTVTAWDTLRECWAGKLQRHNPLAACPGAQVPSQWHSKVCQFN